MLKLNRLPVVVTFAVELVELGLQPDVQLLVEFDVTLHVNAHFIGIATRPIGVITFWKTKLLTVTR